MAADNTTLKLLQIIKEHLGKVTSLTKHGSPDLDENVVYFINDKEAVLKLYRSRASLKSGNELSALSYLESTNITAPTVLGHGYLEDQGPWILMKTIPGVPLSQIFLGMQIARQKEIMNILGQNLAHVHIHDQFEIYNTWDEKTFDPETPFSSQVWRSYAKIRDRYFGMPFARRERWYFEKAAHAANQFRESLVRADRLPHSLVHRQYFLENIIVDNKPIIKGINGIVDWEFATPGDPAEDFAVLYFHHFIKNRDLKDAFFEGYQRIRSIDDGASDRARIYFTKQCFQIAVDSFENDFAYYKKTVELLNLVIKNPNIMEIPLAPAKIAQGA